MERIRWVCRGLGELGSFVFSLLLVVLVFVLATEGDVRC